MRRVKDTGQSFEESAFLDRCLENSPGLSTDLPDINMDVIISVSESSFNALIISSSSLSSSRIGPNEMRTRMASETESLVCSIG